VSHRFLGLDYLRGLLIARIVAFHAALAYADFGSPLLANVAPIVDPEKSAGFAVFEVLNEIFSMPLMYFISGLFVWSGLRRRGALGYALARGKRLGIPFALSAFFLMPLAYYPAFVTHGVNPGPLDYLQLLFGARAWQTGSLWFILLLLVFDLCAAAVYRLAPRVFERVGEIATVGARRPAIGFLVLVALGAIAYVPMLGAFGPYAWVAFGPFALQISRPFHYLLYFFIGVGVGSYGVGRGVLAPESLLIRRWSRWSLLAALLLLLHATVLPPLVGALIPVAPLLALLLYGFAYVAYCAATAIALLALFQRFVTRPIPALTSLAACSYGIYLLHDLFVYWAQYLLLGTSMPAVLKALTVFVSALALSWSLTALARRLWAGTGGRLVAAPAPAGASQPRQ